MESIDLKVFFNKLLKNWLIIVLCCVIGASSAFIYSEFFATPMYMSKIKMSVKSSDWESGVSISGIETTLKLVENCLVVLEDDITAELVVDVLEEETGENTDEKGGDTHHDLIQCGDDGVQNFAADAAGQNAQRNGYQQ